MEIPAEGLKIVAVVGEYEGKAIWRTVGKLIKSKRGQPLIMIDKCFNPNAVYSDDPRSAMALLNCVEYSPEDLEKKQSYANKNSRSSDRSTRNRRPERVQDLDDDIPF